MIKMIEKIDRQINEQRIAADIDVWTKKKLTNKWKQNYRTKKKQKQKKKSIEAPTTVKTTINA